MDQTDTTVAGAVRGWYSVVESSYDYETGPSRNSKAFGHFKTVDEKR